MMKKTSRVFEIVEATVQASGNRLSVKDLCRMAGVSRSGFYAWKKAADVRQGEEARDRMDFDLVLQAYRKRGYKKGARSIAMTLLHHEPPIVMNVKKVRRLMKKYKLVCPIRKANPYRRMAAAIKTNRYADNLLKREFEDYGPRMVLLTDISYLPYKGGVAYLSTILDAYTKQVLAHVVSDSLEVDFVLETIRQLMDKHGNSLKKETIIHSDQGCHYTSLSVMQLMLDKNLRRSMSRRGNCWDNAPQESFFGHMKDSIKEKLKDATSVAEVKAIVDDYIDFYNNDRYQWDLAKLSPNEFYDFYTTGNYPMKVVNAPAPPRALRKPEELGRTTREAKAKKENAETVCNEDHHSGRKEFQHCPRNRN